LYLVGVAPAIAAIAPQRLRGRFVLRAKAPLAGVAKATAPKNYNTGSGESLDSVELIRYN
jgi:hypothetical protein